MRETGIDIPDFGSLEILEDEDETDPAYRLLYITYHNCWIKYKDTNSEFLLYLKENCKVKDPNDESGYERDQIKIRLFDNELIKINIEYLFMFEDDLSKISGTITPLQYKFKIIQHFLQLDD